MNGTINTEMLDQVLEHERTQMLPQHLLDRRNLQRQKFPKIGQPNPPFPERTVYLSGPITGLTYGEARHTWRVAFAELMPAHIHVLSPMRAKEFLPHAGALGVPFTNKELFKQPMGTSRGIITRDENDVKRSDMMVVHLLGATNVSIGTVHELGMARAFRTPVILIMEKDGSNPHSHAFVTETAGYWVDTVDEAAWVAATFLTPGV